MPFRVLIADDEPDLTRAFGEILQDRGYEVDLAYDAESAGASIEKGLFDVFIVDLCLEGPPSLRLISRARARNPEARIIVISGMRSADLAMKAARAGASEYFTKPVFVDDLVSVIDDVSPAEVG